MSQRTDLYDLFRKWFELKQEEFFPGQYDSFIAGWELCEEFHKIAAKNRKRPNVTKEESDSQSLS